jgi:hypothetical protein
MPFEPALRGGLAAKLQVINSLFLNQIQLDTGQFSTDARIVLALEKGWWVKTAEA